MTNAKPGIKTTELGLSLGVHILALLVVLGVLSTSQAEVAGGTWVKTVEAVFALITASMVCRG